MTQRKARSGGEAGSGETRVNRDDTNLTDDGSAVNPPDPTEPKSIHDIALDKIKGSQRLLPYTYAHYGWRHDRGHGSVKAIPSRLVETIQVGYHFARDASGGLMLWDGGVYHPANKQTIDQVIVRLLENTREMTAWSSGLNNQVSTLLRVEAPEVWEIPPGDVVNLTNGLLDLQTKELREHDPQFLSLIQLPVAYDPQAVCPEWDRFVSQVFPEDSEELAWEIVWWLMTTRRIGQKALLLLGQGGNGKSTFLRAVRAFLGNHNTATESIQSLEISRWSTAKLVGKLANIYHDLPHGRLQSSAIFEQITGGDSRINAEHKFQKPFDFEPFCKLVFSTRHPPRINSAAKAFYDRWLVVPFDRVYRGTQLEQDQTEIVSRLSQASELSGVLNRALVGLADLLDQGGLLETQSTRDALARFQGLTDPMLVWIRHHLSEEVGGLVSIQQAYQAYKTDMLKADSPVATDKAFGLAVKRELPEAQRIRKSIGGSRPWYYEGVSMS